jgi:hypothetical protein
MAIIRMADQPLNERAMFRRFARAIIAAAAVGAAIAPSGLAGTANAATRSIPVLYTSNFAGYHTASSDTTRFRYVATTVPVAACETGSDPSTDPDAHIELFGGTGWSADIDVNCNGGGSSVSFYDQLSAITQAAGTFRLSPRVGDRVRISIYRNVPGHQDSFTATDLRTGRSQTVRVTTPAAVVYQHAFVGSAIYRNADVMPLPPTGRLLWAFQDSRVVTYGGVRGTLLGPWTTVAEIDRTSARITVMYPGTLSSSGSSFSIYLHAAP